MRRRLLAAAALALASAAAADPLTETQPVPARIRPATSTDEGGLWQISDTTENKARKSGERLNAPELESYIRGVSCRLAQEYCGDIRVYLMQRPFFNASMAPNGYMEVWSGLLLRVDDEAQLSFVLGHEITHYVDRHTLESMRDMRSRTNGALVLTFALAAAGTAAAVNNPGSAQSIMDSTGNLVDIVYLGTMAGAFNFSRENESKADAGGFQRAVAAGYSPSSGALLWKNLTAENAASDFPKTRAKEARGSIFSTHPLTAERISALQKLAATQTASGKAERDRYRAAIRPYLESWLRDDLRRRDYGETMNIIERLSRSGEDLGLLNFYRGEVYRLRHKEGDAGLARTAYEASMTYADAPAAAWRQMGEMFERSGAKADAQKYFATYLSKAPNAPDKLLIETKLGGENVQNSETTPNPSPAPAIVEPSPVSKPTPAVTSFAP